MIKIKVSNLSNGYYDYEFEGKTSEIEVSDPYIGDFKTKVGFTKFDNQIILDAATSIVANLTCDRCNKEFHSIITSNYRMIYLFTQKIENSENEKMDVVYMHPETDKIDLTEDIRDYALLAVPMKKLCSENCRGLCPNCGINLNDNKCDCKEEKMDPRWEPLLKLKLKNKLN
ncbi:MAG: DUF177 domain-containing protein [Ignavibacteriaceae bacterium]